MRQLYLYGASGHAKVIRDIVEACGDSVAGLFDDDTAVGELQGMTVNHRYDGQSPLIISIGSNRVRKMLSKRFNVVYVSAIHPSAVVSPFASVGEGTVVMQRAVIQTEAQIGRHSIVNTGTCIDHECRIADFVHLSPGTVLCGNVTVGEGTWIGAGTTVIQGINIGRWCMIGAGSVVVKDIPDGCLAYGNPCKVVKLINEDIL